PRGVERAKIGLRQAAPHLGPYMDSGQIEVWDYRDWYLRDGHFDGDRVFGQWVEKEKRSLDSGYKALRVTGYLAWLTTKYWYAFIAYEAEAKRVFPQHRMICLCTYPMSCSAAGVLQIARHHQFALARIAGEWEVIESSIFNLVDEPCPPQTSLSEQL